ncbi:hypothetical protein BC936DRAFT_141080 [Jimgerdemannia flammicorona]|uniref:Uncharacterized protein n=1 Tax=Jimgerdemannia flammicorona TaxID=994334 RepID=A0A433A2X6_9FUNG|nr:hypothetical protein BC936DRAFT_141080 [Jimgerdemannia flammicorona]
MICFILYVFPYSRTITTRVFSPHTPDAIVVLGFGRARFSHRFHVIYCMNAITPPKSPKDPPTVVIPSSSSFSRFASKLIGNPSFIFPQDHSTPRAVVLIALITHSRSFFFFFFHRKLHPFILWYESLIYNPTGKWMSPTRIRIGLRSIVAPVQQEKEEGVWMGGRFSRRRAIRLFKYIIILLATTTQ